MNKLGHDLKLAGGALVASLLAQLGMTSVSAGEATVAAVVAGAFTAFLHKLMQHKGVPK